MGCLARLGCLITLAILAAAAWFTRSYWMPYLDRDRDTATAVSDLPMWQPLTQEGAERARRELARLERRGGPAYVHTSAGDLASFIMQELTQTLPGSADSIEVAAIDDRLHVRASVRVADLGDRTVMGPLASLFGDRERLELAGTLRVIRPGLSELRIRQLRIRDFDLPQALIPRLVGQIMRGERQPELADDGVALRTPDYIADVRIRDGRVTLYKPTAAN